MTALVEVGGTGSCPLFQLFLLPSLFTEHPAGGDVVTEETPAIVRPLELLLPIELEAWDMGTLGVMTGVRVELVGGRGGLM